MKLLKKEIDREGVGFAHVRPDEVEDFWHLYNLINVGDRVKASTVRYVSCVCLLIARAA